MIFLNIHLAELVECTIVLCYVVLLQVLDGLAGRHASEWLFRRFELLQIIKLFIQFCSKSSFCVKTIGHSLG